MYTVKRNSYNTNESLHGFSSFYVIPLKSIICREILWVSTKYITKFHKLFIFFFLPKGVWFKLILTILGGGGWLIICHCFFFILIQTVKHMWSYGFQCYFCPHANIPHRSISFMSGSRNGSWSAGYWILLPRSRLI